MLRHPLLWRCFVRFFWIHVVQFLKSRIFQFLFVCFVHFALVKVSHLQGVRCMSEGISKAYTSLLCFWSSDIHRLEITSRAQQSFRAHSYNSACTNQQLTCKGHFPVSIFMFFNSFNGNNSKCPTMQRPGAKQFPEDFRVVNYNQHFLQHRDDKLPALNSYSQILSRAVIPSSAIETKLAAYRQMKNSSNS